MEVARESMYIDCRLCPLRRTSAFRPLEGEELDFVRAIKRDQYSFPARVDVLANGGAKTQLFTLFSGWAFRYMIAENRERQILDILLPGDLIGLQTPMTGRTRYSVRTVTPVSLCLLDAERFKDIFDDLPDLSEAVVTTLLYEEHRADRRLVQLGCLRPTQRLAFVFLELQERLERRGFIDRDTFMLPLTYEHLADLVGASRSQVGASLIEMRERGWATLSQGKLTIADRPKMVAGCGYTALPEPALRALI